MKSIIGTWPFSEIGVSKAAAVLQSGSTSSALDAVEAGVKAVELDASVTSVGYGGLPNADGVLQLDAAIMSINPTQHGCVMCVEGYPSAISLARLISSSACRHAALSGHGAVRFAEAHGMQSTSSNNSLLTEHARKRYAQYVATGGDEGPRSLHSDTVGMLGVDGSGGVAAACATSGMQFKMPGRVGDSPIIGSGLMADKVGAAAASGDGDMMMRYCLANCVIHSLRQGLHVQQAVDEAVQLIINDGVDCQAAVVAMDEQGHVAAAATHTGFIAVAWDDTNGLRKVEAKGLGQHKWLHSCV